MAGTEDSTVYPDAEDQEKQHFEYLIVAKLGEDLGLDAIYRYDWQAFTKARSWDKRMGAWYIGLSQRRLRQPQVILAPKSPT